jgi:hypothetical protein
MNEIFREILNFCRDNIKTIREIKYPRRDIKIPSGEVMIPSMK